MKRAELLDLDSTGTRRVFTQPLEVRANSEGDRLTFRGVASVLEHSYPVFGGPPYGWNETIAVGAYKRTILNGADVSFKVNHEGLTMARTKNGTLTLDERDNQLVAVAEMNPARNDVNDLYHASNDGEIDEMSFAGQFTSDEWTDENGEPSNRMVGTERRVLEINLHKGDVSAVNYGMNDATSGGFREIDRALAELRSGRPLTDEQRAMIRELAGAIEETEPTVPAEIVGYSQLWDALKG